MRRRPHGFEGRLPAHARHLCPREPVRYFSEKSEVHVPTQRHFVQVHGENGEPRRIIRGRDLWQPQKEADRRRAIGDIVRMQGTANRTRILRRVSVFFRERLFVKCVNGVYELQIDTISTPPPKYPPPPQPSF